MCVAAAAFPDRYLAGTISPGSWKLPPRELEYDMAGKVEVKDAGKGGQHVTIDVGEVKTSSNYGDAVQQLGLRLGVLRWLVPATVKGTDLADVQLIGRMFVLRDGVPEDVKVDRQQQRVAKEEWGYKLVLCVV